MQSKDADACGANNLSVLSSIYHTKGFTKYAIYTAIAYGVTRNPKAGLLALNCNTAAFVVFNYIRFFNPELFGVYKESVKKKSNVGELTFQAGDLAVHVLPLCMVVASRKNWYNYHFGPRLPSRLGRIFISSRGHTTMRTVSTSARHMTCPRTTTIYRARNGSAFGSWCSCATTSPPFRRP